MPCKIVLNSDVETVNRIKEQLKLNGGYCPCRLDRTEDTKCMCKEFRDIVANGEKCLCHCGLYKAI